MSQHCGCMDGPNEPDPSCLYCGGTGEFVSDERLAELIDRYKYLVENSNSISRRDFKTSDAQHVAIFTALQIARDASSADMVDCAMCKPHVVADQYESSCQQLFKRGMNGTYQHCAEKHLHRYLAEFDFRHNNRVALGVGDVARAAHILSGIVGKRLTYETTRKG